MARRGRYLTFSAELKDIEKLKKLAKQGGISVSALLSRILKSYLGWEHIASSVGMITVQKNIIIEVLDFIDDEDLKRIAIRAADRFMDKLLVITGKNTLDSFLCVTRERVEKSRFTLSEFTEDGETQLAILHHMGRKWSVFSSAFHKRIIENLGYHAETEINDNLWIVRISKVKH